MALDNLRELRDGYSEEIPKEIVHEGKYKVRAGWFGKIVSNIERGLSDGSIDSSLAEECNEFINQYTADGTNDPLLDHSQPNSVRKITKQDIAKGNRIINLILGRK